jgi:hypothetical protein
MFNLDNLRTLLNAQPFIPLRLHLSNGSFVEVRSREQVLPARLYALVALLDPQAADSFYDRHVYVWHVHVTSVEMLGAGPPALGLPPAGPAGIPTPAPA